MAEDTNLYRCTLCDAKVEESGRYGHVRFTDGDGHGPKGEVPEDADEYFVLADSSIEDTDEPDDDDEPEGNAGGASDSTTDRNGGDSGNGRRAEGTGEATDETDSVLTRLKTWLTTPINE